MKDTRVKPTLASLLQNVREWYDRTTSRERAFLGLAAAVAIFLGLYTVIEETLTAFHEQSVALENAEETIEQLGPLLVQYARLEREKKRIESRFEGANMKVGIRSYIEDLAKKKASITSRINIQPTQAEPFGENFELTKISVTFSSEDPAQVITFLKEIHNSEHPIIISKLDVRRSGTRLQVQTNLSSINRRSGSSV